MIFGLFSSKPKEKYVKFLNAADEAYIQAHNIKSMRTLKEYVTPECALKVSKSVYGGCIRYFGVAKFRNTKWEVISENNNQIDFVKNVVYDKVRVSPTLKLNIADDYKQLWSLDTKNMKVIDIRTLA